MQRRQGRVGQIGEQRRLFLSDGTLGLRHFLHHRLDTDRRRIDALFLFHRHDGFAFLLRHLAQLAVAIGLPGLDRLPPGPFHPLAGALGAGEQAESDRHQQQQDQRAAGEPQQRTRRRADAGAQHTAMRVGQRHRPVPGAQPFDPGAGKQQQAESAEPEPALAAVCQRRFIQMAKGVDDVGQGQQHPPPGRHAKNHQQQIGQPGAAFAAKIVDRHAIAGGAETGVGHMMGEQNRRQQQRGKPHQQRAGFAQQALHAGRQGGR